jgi:hypothetical protein
MNFLPKKLGKFLEAPERKVARVPFEFTADIKRILPGRSSGGLLRAVEALDDRADG